MERNGQNRTRYIGLIAIFAILAGSLIAQAEAREGYIMNLLLSAMHDVRITNPLDGQVLTYDSGTFTWINANASSTGSETTECINLANQYQLILNSTNGNCYVRALANGNNISISTNSTHAIISATGSTDTTDCINLASQYQIILNSTNGDCFVRALAPSTGISISTNSTHAIITNSAPEATNCNNVGSGNPLHKTGTNCSAFSLIAGDSISITNTTDDYTIAGLRVGQSIGVVYASVTKTNIGTAFVDIYVTAFDMENQMRVDCRNVSQFMFVYQWDYVGTGSQNLRIVNANNNAEVLVDVGIIADQDAGSTGWGDVPSWCGDNPSFDSDIILEAQGKSTVAGDDPIMRGYKILFR